MRQTMRQTNQIELSKTTRYLEVLARTASVTSESMHTSSAYRSVRGGGLIYAIVCVCVAAAALAACGGFSLEGSWKITEGPTQDYGGPGWMWPRGQVIVFDGGETNLMPQFLAPPATYLLEDGGGSGTYTLSVTSGWNSYEFSLRVISNNEVEIGNVPNYDGRVILKRS